MGIENAKYIHELDLEYTPSFQGNIFNQDNGLLATIKKSNILPFKEKKIYYSDDVWYLGESNYANTSLLFTKCPDVFRDVLKDYTIITFIQTDIRLITLKNHVSVLSRFFTFLYEDNIIDIQTMSISDVKIILNKWEYSDSLCMNFIYCFKNFLSFYNTFIRKYFGDEWFAFLNEQNYVKNSQKTPNIPDEYFNKLILKTMNIARDKTADTLNRGIACMILILSQTGIRVGELVELKINSLKEKEISSGQTTSFLIYETTKRTHGNSSPEKVITYANEIVVFAYKTLVELYDELRKQHKSEYLFPEVASVFNKVDVGRFYCLLDDFFYSLNSDDFRTVYYTKIENPPQPLHKKGRGKDVIYISRPNCHQFRVHACTELYNKGVPIEYIQRYMSHLTSETTSAYIRPQNTPQEDMAASIEILKGIVNGDLTPIGTDKKRLINGIQQFINDNHFNIEKDMDAIVNKLSEKIPIRIKAGGACIKSSLFRECSVDAKTNEFYCAYGVCPNLFTFYYTIDVTYEKCKTLQDAIIINENRGCEKQVQKNKNMLKTIAQKQLLPELEELKRLLDEKGRDWILEKHPELFYILNNYSTIIKEASEWISNYA